MPFDKVIVSTAGIASGIAATAKIIAIWIISTKGLSVISPATSTATPAMKAATIIALLNLSNSISSGVFHRLLHPTSH